MGEEPASTAPARYRAFVSYSHADAGFANWLHRKLEAWRLPDKTRLAPAFIDRAELSAGADLSAKVRDALADSAALVVVASPNARASRWVDREIALFRELHPDRPVLAALIAGEPDEAFPPALCQIDGTAVEPLAADFRKGQDGKRLGLLKIAAGLTGLPLDRLVQRDAQARQRRVMWITAGALLLSLILAALLVFALRARAEAERQRAEAEGLVEFMLTDLRDKLKGVGRLDVMDAVNERAMARYAAADIDALPQDEALRRARLLLTMGADDLDRAGEDPSKAAIRRRAERRIAEAWGLTKKLLLRSGRKADFVFAHAQSEFYMGAVHFSHKDAAGRRDIEHTRPHWQAYLILAEELVRLEPGKSDWLREKGFAEGSMCSLELESKVAHDAALTACHNASLTLFAVQKLKPGELKPVIDYANRLGWEADANLAAGKSSDALELRKRRVDLSRTAVLRFPHDAQAKKALMLAEVGLAQTLIKLGDTAQANAALDRAEREIAELRALDPDNGNWEDRAKQIGNLRLSIRAGSSSH